MDTLGFSGENITAVVTGSGVHFTGLLPGVTYSINVISIASGGKQTPSANLNLTTSPITPSGITVTNITNVGFTVGWNVDPGTTSHSFQINEIEVIPSAQTLTYAIISTLNPNTLYTLGVSAVNDGGSTPAANTVQVLTAPAPASNFSSTITTTTIVVRWSGSEGAVSFTYSMNGAPVTPSSSQTTVAPFSATFSGLTPDTPYTFVVTGRGSRGSTTDSQPYAIATDGPPKQLSSNNVKQTTFGLAWKGSLDSATYSYLINGNPPSFYSMNVATVGRTAAFSGASPNTTYSIVVVKSTPTPPLSSTPITVTTLPPPPTAPVVSYSVTSTSITLTWTGSPTALSFSYSINGSTVIPTTTGYQTATFTGLQPFTTYSSVIVIATNTGGSTPSTPLFITTLPLPPAAPVLSYSNVTSQGFTISWQSITGVNNYTYSLNGINTTPDLYSPTSATFGSLSGNTTYTVLVRAINDAGSTSSSPLVVTTLMGPPLPPTNLVATVIGSTRLTISWTIGAGTTGYIYTLNGSRYTPFSTTSNSATFTGLASNQLYNIIITSVNNGGSADSQPLDVTTNMATPDVPVLVASAITQTNFIVSWQPNSGATSYAYTVDGVPNSVVTVLAENSIYLSGFLPNSLHTLIVTSTNNSGRYVSSTTLSVTTLRAPPSAFTLTPGTITSTSISITWAPITGVTGYTFKLDGIDVTPTSSNYLSNATFGNLNSNQGYDITVTAINNGGSTPSNINLTTYMTPPTAPTALASNSITSTSFSITWTPGTGASSYSYTLNGITTTPLLSNTSSATFNNLASNTNYNVIVIATNNGGSASSAALPVVTLLAPPSPFSITSSAITSSSFIISWTPSTATSYTYTLNGQSASPTPITASSVSFTGLTANSAYNVIVTATNNSGIFVSSSPTLTVTTLMIAPGAATNLQFAPITSSGFTVSWTAGLRVTSYSYTLNGSPATPSSSTATSATFTALAANTVYNVIVISTNNGGSTPSVAAPVTTNMLPPSAPVLVAGAITNTSITASWQSGTGATSYTYTLGGSPATPASSTATSATFTGLTPDTSYNLIVTAINNSGVPAASNPLSIRTRLNAPSAPVITSSALTSSGFLISWQSGTGATSYSYTLNGSPATPSSTTATSATFTALTANTLYNVIVTAINNGGSVASNTLPVTTNMLPPSAPVLVAGAITNTSITASWQSGTGATSYTYTLGGSPATPASSTATSATFTGLTPDTSYNLIVTAINNSGVPAASNPLSIRTRLNAPSAPVITSSALTSSGFLISWQTGTGATSYSYTLNGSPATPSSTTATSATFTALASNTLYSVIVTAINNGGSAASNSLSVTTNMAPPSAPVLVAGAITNTSITASWQSGTGATSYTYTLGGSPATPASSTATSATFTGLTPDTSYNLIVTAINNSGVPAASNPLSIKTRLNAPSAPVITSSAVTSNGFLISWQSGTGATSYSYTLNGSSATPSSTTATSATFTALAPNTPYSVIVTAINNGGSAASNTISVTTNMGPPSAPTLSQGATAETQFTVNWQSGTGATSYTYTLNSNTVTPSSTTATSATFTGLTANTTYSVVVTAINNSGMPAPSSPLSITTLMVPPTSLTLTSSSITSSSFVVSWQSNSGATSYAYSLNGTTTTPSTTTPTSATFTGLTANRSYVVAVTAINNNPIQRTSSITIRTIIDPPTGLASSSVSYTSFTLNWSGSSGATTYRFLLNSVTATPTYTSGATVAYFTGLDSGTLYNTQVVATDGSYNSLPSTALPVTTQIPPDPVTYSSSGTPLPNSFTIPAGFSYAYIEALAGSGGGGGGNPQGGVGGGGGAYVYGTVAITPGGLISITSPPITGGAGGAGGSSQSPYWQFPGSDGTSLALTIVGNNITIQGGGGGNGGGYVGTGWGPNGNITSGNPTNPRNGQGGSVTGTLPSGLVSVNGNNVQNDYTVQNGSSGGAAGNPNYGGGHGGSNTVGYTRGVTGSPGYYNIRLVYTLSQLNKPLLHASSFTTTGFTVTWQPLTGATNYTYTLNGVAAGTTTSQIAVFTGKASGTTYSVIVTANYPSQPSVSSDTLSVTTLPLAPVITAGTITNFGFTVNWQSGTGATNYSYLLNDVSATPVSQTATSATFGSLLGNTAYNILVTSINGSNTAASNQLSITTLTPPPVIYSSEGQQISGTIVSGYTAFNAPSGYKYIYMELLAGCGTSSSASNGYYSAGGGGGAYLYGTLTITPSTQIQMGYVTNDNSTIPGGGTVIGGSGSVRNGYRVIVAIQGNTYTAYEGTGAGSGSVAQQGNGGNGGSPPTSLGVVTAISGSNGTGSSTVTYGVGGASGRGDTYGGSGAASSSDSRIAPGDNGAYLMVFAGSISQITSKPFLYNRGVSSSTLRVGWQNGLNVSSYTFTLNGVTTTPSSSLATSAAFSGLTPDTSYNIIMDANYNGVHTISNTITIRTLLPPIAYSSRNTVLPVGFTIPTGYTQMYVEILAGSGGGGGSGAATNPSGGGGGAGYLSGITSVTPGTSLTITPNTINGGIGGYASYTYRRNPPQAYDYAYPGSNGDPVTFTIGGNNIVVQCGNGGNAGGGFGSGFNPPAPTNTNASMGGIVTTTSGLPSGLVASNGTNGSGSTFNNIGSEAPSGKLPAHGGYAGQGNVDGALGYGGIGSGGYYLIAFANSMSQMLNVPIITSGTITSTTITVNWQSVLTTTSLTYSLNGTLTTPSSTTSSSATFTGLTPNTPYTVIVNGITGGITTPSSPITITTSATLPLIIYSSSGSQFPSFGLINVPTGYTQAYITLIGGGGGSDNNTAAGGGGGYVFGVCTIPSSNAIIALTTGRSDAITGNPNGVVAGGNVGSDRGYNILVTGAISCSVTGGYGGRQGSGGGAASSSTSGINTVNGSSGSGGIGGYSGAGAGSPGRGGDTISSGNSPGSPGSYLLALATSSAQLLAAPILDPGNTLVLSTSIKVVWQSGVNASSYTYSLNGSSASPSSTTSTSATFTGLSSSTTYAIIVTAVYNGVSTSSNTISVTTNAALPPIVFSSAGTTFPTSPYRIPNEYNRATIDIVGGGGAGGYNPQQVGNDGGGGGGGYVYGTCTVTPGTTVTMTITIYATGTLNGVIPGGNLPTESGARIEMTGAITCYAGGGSGGGSRGGSIGGSGGGSNQSNSGLTAVNGVDGTNGTGAGVGVGGLSGKGGTVGRGANGSNPPTGSYTSGNAGAYTITFTSV